MKMTTTHKDLNQITKNYLRIMKGRRSNYVVTNKAILSDKQLVKFVEDCLANAPSSFNFKSQRVVILFNEKHKKL
ncbi:hypothetical protein FACS1894166_07020 [Bacilli bacterium]|nr:hypothetical protein FACS1894166_07020 [Bacilli bacterium]